MSMAHSLEVRVPLLDDTVVAATQGNTDGLLDKKLLAASVDPKLISVAASAKQTFTLPVEGWLRGPLHGWAGDMLQVLARSGLGLDSRELWALFRDFELGRAGSGAPCGHCACSADGCADRDALPPFDPVAPRGVLFETMRPMAEATELGLADFTRIIWRHKVSIVAVAILAAAATFGLDTRRTKIFEARAQVLLTPTLSQAVSSASGTATPLSATDVATDAKVISSPANQRAAAALIKVPSVPPASVSEVATTNVVRIAVQSADPAFAVGAANAYAQAYISGQQNQAVNSLEAAATQLSARIAALTPEVATIQHQIAALTAPTTTAYGAQPSSPTSNPAVIALENQQNSLVEQQTTLREQATQLQDTAQLAGGGGQIIGAATLPAVLVSPHRVRDTALAGGIGLVLGLGVAFLWEFLDDRIRGEEDVEAAMEGVPALGLIPTVPEWVSRRRAKRGGPHVIAEGASATSPAAEAYRSLRTSIQFLRLDKEVRSILVSSPYSNEGKTTTVANLAATMAQVGHRIGVVSCDLRKPELHAVFGLTNDTGFTSVILGQTSPRKALQRVDGYDDLWVMPAGPVPPNPSELLASRQAQRLFKVLADRFEIVLIDSPPVLPVTDAAILAAYADATLIVIAAGSTTKRQARRAVEILTQVDAAPVGVIVNRIPHRGGTFYYGYGYGYRYGHRSSARMATAKPGVRFDADIREPDGPDGDWDPVSHSNGAAASAPVASRPATRAPTIHRNRRRTRAFLLTGSRRISSRTADLYAYGWAERQDFRRRRLAVSTRRPPAPMATAPAAVIPATSAPVTGITPDGATEAGEATARTVTPAEAVMLGSAMSVAVTTCAPGAVPAGTVNTPEPVPAASVVTVPRVTGSLRNTMVKVTLKTVPRSVTVIVPPGKTVLGVMVIVTISHGP